MKIPLSLLAIALILSGCTGVPEGAADLGDQVTVTWTALDPATGDVVVSGGDLPLTFIIGSGQSSLGFDFERQMIGHAVGETFTFTAGSDPAHEEAPPVEADLHYNLGAQEFTASRLGVEQRYGPITEVGQSIETGGLYPFKVVSFDDNTVDLHVVVEDGDVQPYPALGSTLTTHVQNGQMTADLTPIPGALAFIAPPNQDGATFGGFPSGAYHVLGEQNGSLVMQAGGDVTFEVTVVSVQNAPESQVPSENFGVRQSPQLLGQYAAEDDGHTDHTH